MYDYATIEFLLTLEEQEKAQALRRLELDIASKTVAVLAFRNNLRSEISKRLADPDQLSGAWTISQNDTKVIIC